MTSAPLASGPFTPPDPSVTLRSPAERPCCAPPTPDRGLPIRSPVVHPWAPTKHLEAHQHRCPAGSSNGASHLLALQQLAAASCFTTRSLLPSMRSSLPHLYRSASRSTAPDPGACAHLYVDDRQYVAILSALDLRCTLSVTPCRPCQCPQGASTGIGPGSLSPPLSHARCRGFSYGVFLPTYDRHPGPSGIRAPVPH
jgi:hypothetical protein